MPSLHAADALIVGVMLAIVCRQLVAKVFWASGRPWVWFAVMATGNHFWLDVARGVVVALIAFAIMSRSRLSAVLAALTSADAAARGPVRAPARRAKAHPLPACAA